MMLMRQKRRASTGAVSSAPKRRRANSDEDGYRGRLIIRAVDPRQTRSKAARPGAEPLLALSMDHDGEVPIIVSFGFSVVTQLPSSAVSSPLSPPPPSPLPSPLSSIASILSSPVSSPAASVIFVKYHPTPLPQPSNPPTTTPNIIGGSDTSHSPSRTPSESWIGSPGVSMSMSTTSCSTFIRSDAPSVSSGMWDSDAPRSPTFGCLPDFPMTESGRFILAMPPRSRCLSHSAARERFAPDFGFGPARRSSGCKARASSLPNIKTGNRPVVQEEILSGVSPKTVVVLAVPFTPYNSPADTPSSETKRVSNAGLGKRKRSSGDEGAQADDESDSLCPSWCSPGCNPCPHCRRRRLSASSTVAQPVLSPSSKKSKSSHGSIEVDGDFSKLQKYLAAGMSQWDTHELSLVPSNEENNDNNNRSGGSASSSARMWLSQYLGGQPNEEDSVTIMDNGNGFSVGFWNPPEEQGQQAASEERESKAKRISDSAASDVLKSSYPEWTVRDVSKDPNWGYGLGETLL
ncbi:hypothetical protein B0T22DRAFT_511550 [Podospora appendiculata]|uniref:Uncharacterized protein n=1 Tax=Podospora appendiculata TaxID=314037 RepID=A0AAE0X923_9PEZI|nr:hypothetical protein B0T22DRAFT_511550 [Podospora appendiculata]